MLAVEDIALLIDGKGILNSLSFKIKQGQTFGIVGKSGAGKSSLLRIIAGLQDASSGNVYLDNEKVIGPATKLVPGHDEIALVHQDFGLDMYHTVEQNVHGIIPHLHKKSQSALTKELLELVELHELKDQLAHTLSGGEQQRLSIARALAREPKVLLLDEPFAHLDYRLKLKISHYLKRLNELRKTTIILVSHDGSELLSIADQILFIKNGKLRRKAKPLDFYYKYNSFEEGLLFGFVNRIKLDDEWVYFRPDEFEVNKKIGIPVQFQRANFVGSFYINHFLHLGEQEIILFDANILQDVQYIQLKRK